MSEGTRLLSSLVFNCDTYPYASQGLSYPTSRYRNEEIILLRSWQTRNSRFNVPFFRVHFEDINYPFVLVFSVEKSDMSQILVLLWSIFFSP